MFHFQILTARIFVRFEKGEKLARILQQRRQRGPSSRTRRKEKSNMVQPYYGYVVCVPDTEDLPIPGGVSAIEYWEQSVGRKRGTCANYNCRQPATDGAHVRLYDAQTRTTSSEMYVIPLCHRCNEQEGNPFLVNTIIVQVPSK